MVTPAVAVLGGTALQVSADVVMVAGVTGQIKGALFRAGAPLNPYAARIDAIAPALDRSIAPDLIINLVAHRKSAILIAGHGPGSLGCGYGLPALGGGAKKVSTIRDDCIRGSFNFELVCA
jgi:hypothetical protein